MKKKEIRKKKIRRRKNFFPTLGVILILWGLAFFMIYFVDPTSAGIVPLFFLLIFTALFFTSATIFINTRRGLILALGITLFLLLKYLGVGNYLNFLLIAGVGISIDLYFSKN